MIWQTWLFALDVTLPNIILLFLGVFLGRVGLISEQFCHEASRLVFNITLPCLLFLGMQQSPEEELEGLSIVLFGAGTALVSYLLMEMVAQRVVTQPRDRGVFVQGAFRSNMGVLGLAFVINAYGNQGLSIAALYMSSTLVLYNIFSVITLTRSLQTETKGLPLRLIIRNILLNPIIIAVVIGLLFAATRLQLPSVLEKSVRQLGSITLPLSLLFTGASLNLRSLYKLHGIEMLAALLRLVVIPGAATLVGWLLGFQGSTLGVIFLLNAVPTAVASYAMTRAMGGNATLAANIIGITTIGSCFTITFGLVILRYAGVI
ncbi:MAG: AEC family transporter [Enterobacteriaceae bacterium]